MNNLYVKIDVSGVTFPYSITDFRHSARRGEFSENGESIHIPTEPSEALLESFGVYPVAQSPEPTEYGYTSSNAVPQSDGTWLQVWSVRDYTEDEKIFNREGMVVSMRQARLAMLNSGILGNVEAALAAMVSPEKEQAEIEWQYSTTVERNSPLITLLAPGLNLSDDEVDELFRQAEKL